MKLFITVILLCILGGVETDLFIPSFPELREEFNLTPFMVQLTLSVNFIAFCLCALFAGTMGDRYNARHIIIISLFIFIFGSVLTVFALNFPMLLLGRFFQGVGIAAPTTLAFVFISDKYPLEKQAGLIGMMNGAITVSMAFAPAIGSYINLFFHWRGNFVALLILGVLCLVMSFLFIPNREGNKEISLSPRTYIPLFKSKILMNFCAAITFIATAYFLFVGMSSLLYIEALGVPLEHFGYYQGSIAAVFAIFSLGSPKLLAIFGQKRCLKWGVSTMLVAGIMIFIMAVSNESNPIMITIGMMIFSAGALFPINILYPHSLHVIEGAKSRISAVMVSGRLALLSVSLGVVSLFYHHTFMPIGLGVSLFIAIAVFFLYLLLAKRWVILDN